MDISKAEKQVPTEQRRLEDSDYLRIFLQDILSLLILLCLGMVVVLGVLCVVYNVKYQEQHNHCAKTNVSRVMPPNEPTCKCTWFQFFRCLKQQPQLDAKLEVFESKGDQGEIHPAKLEEPDKQQPFAPHLAPTYHHPQLQAGGDHN